MASIIRSDVCIVGDGAVGKAAALGFSKQGLRVTLLSSAAARPETSAVLLPEWDVRVFALNHVAHDLLDGLKVWGALDAARVAPVTGMRVMDAAGGDRHVNADAEIAFDAYGAYINELAWIVEDSNLNFALSTAMRFASHMQVVSGQARDLQVGADEACITLENGDQLIASLVVGADGAQSWVRAQCDIGLDYRSYGQQGVVTNFECEKPHLGVAHQWFVEAQGIIALLPLPGNRVSLVWSAPDALAQTLMNESLEALAARLLPYCETVLGKLTPVQPHTVKAFPLRLMRPHSMVAPRVALIGDAAHVVHPLAGHGMNLGFGDVTSLLAIIAEREAHRDCGDERLLSRYRRSRKEEVTLMQVATDGLSRLFASDLTAVRQVRSLGLNFLNRLPVLKRKLITHAMGKSS
jgi:ubiquinone biosynthesis UbiH/UbiF/VisC/COQ6 family hydroxylase